MYSNRFDLDVGEEDATMHCVDCNEHIGPSCLVPHRKMKMSAMHQQIPLDEALAGNLTARRIPRCAKHIGYEVNTYCKTYIEAVCAMCAVEKHPKHDVCLLDEMTGPLQDQIAGYTISMTKREEEARKAITTMDGTINKIEEHRSAAEKEIAAFVSTLHAEVDARGAVLVSEMQTKGDQLRKTSIQEKCKGGRRQSGGKCPFIEEEGETQTKGNHWLQEGRNRVCHCPVQGVSLLHRGPSSPGNSP